MKKVAKKIRNWSLIILGVAIPGLFTIYVLMILFPQPLFSYKVEYKNFKVYSHQKLDNYIYDILDSADSKLKSSELYKPTIKHKIFLCNGFNEYAFFTPIARTAYACNYPWFNNIFLAKSDIKGNLVFKKLSTKTRTLCGTIVHEICHTFIEKEIGLLKYKSLSAWKNEGYCDYIANESSIKMDDGLRQFCTNQLQNDYFLYRLMVTYLMKKEVKSCRKILKNKYNLDDLLGEIKKNTCDSISKFSH